MKKIDLSFLRAFSDKFFSSAAIVNPKRDWKILLALLFIMIAGSVAFDAFLYRDITSGEMYVSVAPSDLHIQDIDTATLEKAVNDFESKQGSIAGLKLQKLIDPSL